MTRAIYGRRVAPRPGFPIQTLPQAEEAIDINAVAHAEYRAKRSAAAERVRGGKL